MTKGNISIGIVGCGYWGPLLVRNFNNLPNCSLIVVCDASEARLKHIRALYPSVSCVTDYNRLFADFDLDAIVIATPVKLATFATLIRADSTWGYSKRTSMWHGIWPHMISRSFFMSWVNLRCQ